MSNRLKAITIVLSIWISQSAIANSGVTYHGRILRSDSSPVQGQFVGFRLRVMDGNTGSCQMYEEIQTKDMRNSGGVFSIVIGDGSIVGTYSVTGVSLFDGLFQNAKVFNFPVGHTCEFIPYTAATRDGRKLNVSFRESPTDPWEDMPTMNIEHVPFAFSSLVSQKVGNHGDGSLLRVENAGVPQSIPALTPTQYTELFNLVGGSSTQYVQSVLGTASQITVNTAAGVATVGLADVATAGVYGSATQVPVFTLDAKGRITSVTNTTITGAAPTGVAGGDLTGNYPNPDIAANAVGTAEIAASAVTDAKLAADSVITAKILDANVTANKLAADSVTTVKILDSNVTLNKLATDSVNSAKIVDGSIVGADISSTAALSVASVTTTGAVTSDSVSTRSIGLFELPVNGTNYIAHKAPDLLAGNTTYTWPAAAPGSNMVLQSDATGQLSWVAASSGSITGLTGDVVASGTGSVTATIQPGAVDAGKLANDAVTTVKVADDAIRFEKYQNITDNKLLGRSAGSNGDMQEITVGTGLNLSGGTLTATATAPSDASYAAKGIVQFDTDAATSGITVASGIAKLATSGVAANAYGAADKVPVFAVDAFGRITTVTDTNIAIAASQVTSGILDVARGGTGTGTLTANRMFMANGTGTALTADTCTIGQVLEYNGTTWACKASNSFGSANAFVQNGNAFGAKATLGTTDNNTLEFITNNTAKMTVLAGGNVGIGTTTPNSSLEVYNSDASSAMAIVNGGGSSNIRNLKVELTNYKLSGGAGQSTNIFEGRLGRGSIASPAALVSGEQLLSIRGSGSYNTTVGTFVTGASINMQTSAGWSAGSYPTQMTFNTVSSGTASPNETMRLTSTGTVGIGTTTPTAKLHINDVPGDLPGQGYSLNNWGGTGVVPIFARSATNNGGSTPAAAQPALVLAREGVSGQSYSNVAEFNLSRYANVSDNARTRLDISLNDRAATYAKPVASFIAADADATVGTYSILELNRNFTSAVSRPQMVAFKLGRYQAPTSESPDTRLDIALKSTTDNTMLADKTVMTMQSNGNVGIGTTAPTDPLVIQTSKDGRLLHLLNSTVSSDYYPEMRISHYRNFTTGGGPIISAYHARGTIASPSAVVSGMPLLSLQGRGFAEAGFGADRIGAQIDFTASSNWGNSNLSTDMIFSTAASGSWTTSERMRILSGGNVGIGTNNPGTKLQVAGVISPSVDNTHDLGTSSLRFKDIYAANNVIQTSDARLKTEIKESDLGLDFINNLRPVSYFWKEGDTKLHYGVIAQETESALAKAKKLSGRENEIDNVIVTHDESTDRYGVRYTELIAPIIKSIQELSHLIFGVIDDVDALRVENQKLKQENATQSKQIEEMKAQLDRIEKMLMPK